MSILRVILILFCLFSVQGIVAQIDSTKNRQVKSEIKNYLSDKEYTRIPNKDFDRILQNAVDEEVKNKLMFWLTLISIVIAVFGGIAALAFNQKIKQVVQAELEMKNGELLSNIDKMVKESKLNKLAVDLETLKEKNKSGIKLETIKAESYRLLNEAKELKNLNLIPDILDVIASLLFNERNIEEIDNLINEYEVQCEIMARTYASAAILNMDFYELDGVTKHKNNCIKYSFAAINQNIYYGDPRGVLILVHAIDLAKSEEVSEKENAKNNVKNIISEILKGTSGYIASNTCQRLERDGDNNAFKKYLVAVRENMPEEFLKLYDKAAAYDQRDNLNKAQNQ